MAIDSIFDISTYISLNVPERTAISLSFWNLVSVYQLPTIDASLLPFHVKISVLILAVTSLQLSLPEDSAFVVASLFGHIQPLPIKSPQ